MERGIQYPGIEYPCAVFFNYVAVICLPQLFRIIVMNSISFHSDFFHQNLVMVVFLFVFIKVTASEVMGLFETFNFS